MSSVSDPRPPCSLPCLLVVACDPALSADPGPLDAAVHLPSVVLHHQRSLPLWLRMQLSLLPLPLHLLAVPLHASPMGVAPVLAALDLAIALTALQFRKTDKKAAALLVPYLAW